MVVQQILSRVMSIGNPSHQRTAQLHGDEGRLKDKTRTMSLFCLMLLQDSNLGTPVPLWKRSKQKMYQIQINLESLLIISGTLLFISLWSIYSSTRTPSYKLFRKLPYIQLSAGSSLPLPSYRRFESLKNGKRILQQVYQEASIFETPRH